VLGIQLIPYLIPTPAQKFGAVNSHHRYLEMKIVPTVDGPLADRTYNAD